MSPATVGNPPEQRLVAQEYELTCADVHPVCCEEVMSSRDPEELVARVREHGGHAHGFTPAWYSAARLAGMAEAVTTR